MRKLITILFLFIGTVAHSQIVKNQEWEFNKKVTLDDSVRITTGAGAGKVLTSDTRGIATWQSSGTGVVQSATVTLSSADILSLHTTPITIITAQGAGTAVQLLMSTYSMTYNTTPYATDVTLRIYNGTAVAGTDGSALSATDNYYANRSLISNFSTTGATNPYENVDVTISTPTSNPTAGDSEVTITVLYSVITF